MVVDLGPAGNATFGDHLGPMLFGPEPSWEAVDLATRFRRAWTSFATTGDPGWPAYDGERLVQVFDTSDEVAAYPEETSRRLWQDQTFTALPLLHGSW